MFRERLKDIVERCDGAMGGVVMGFDGIVVDSYTLTSGTDVQTIGMELAFVLIQVRKASEILEVGKLEEISIRSEQLVFLVRILSDEYFLGIALRPSGNFGKGRHLMRMAVPELRANL